jgi:Putative bacterial sensory transduction regulator
MTKFVKLVLAMLVAFCAAPAMAADTEPCAAGLVCASKPETVVSAMQDAGYKAKLTKDDGGDPMITSSSAGYDFDIFFYGCVENKQCASLQFKISFVKDPANTPALANKWNNKRRFSQAYVNDKGLFVTSYDVTTIGGLTKANFTDLIDWWSVILGNLKTFFDENLPPKP